MSFFLEREVSRVAGASEHPVFQAVRSRVITATLSAQRPDRVSKLNDAVRRANGLEFRHIAVLKVLTLLPGQVADSKHCAFSGSNEGSDLRDQ